MKGTCISSLQKSILICVIIIDYFSLLIRYKQRATAIAKTIRDEQITPQRKALWTVEWVLRNYGTIQLLDDLNEVGYIEKNSLDVLSTLIIISICINFLLFRIIQVCVSFMTARVVRKNKMKKTP